MADHRVLESIFAGKEVQLLLMGSDGRIVTVASGVWRQSHGESWVQIRGASRDRWINLDLVNEIAAV